MDGVRHPRRGTGGVPLGVRRKAWPDLKAEGGLQAGEGTEVGQRPAVQDPAHGAVAGGPNANRYIYDASTGFASGIDSDTGLVPPLTGGGQMPGIGRVDLCFKSDNYT
ncbi:hypothetical protein AB0N17_28290 [Streptomyces sp. NPDC051133]|uniref:hypothetical protein n=1 Tax=Streptomyces sp. NPDC051133 TaxID=3155521 RepID=UPI0034314D11